MLETVKAVRDYLDAELAKYDRLSDAPVSLMNLLSSNEHTFQDIKAKGVGQTTILKFLGRNWKQHAIQDALRIHFFNVDHIFLWRCTLPSPM